MFDRIFKFAHIPRPVELAHLVYGQLVDPTDNLSIAFGKNMHESPDKERNILATFIQSRYLDCNHIETIEQIAAKTSFRYSLREIPIRRCNKPAVDGNRAIPTASAKRRSSSDRGSGGK